MSVPDGPLIDGPRPCGCVYVHPWYSLCPAARAWEATLAAAIKAGEIERARDIGWELQRHQQGQPLPPAAEVAALMKGER